MTFESLSKLRNGAPEQDNTSSWIVQKFGGTSVGKLPRGIAENIVRAALVKNRIAVVCSARSNSTKAEGTTNRLLRAAREAEKRNSKACESIVQAIYEDHVTAARANIQNPDLLGKLVKDIQDECDVLNKILESAQYLNIRAEDKIISEGEKLSCRFMTALLRDCGVNAKYIDVSDVLRPQSSASSPHTSGLVEAFYIQAATELGQEILVAAEDDTIVPVITGYFGTIPNGLLKTIGRGYTDLCAALIAVGLRASELQVWKEVDGIFTADPRKVPTACLLASVTPAEAAELTFYGSEVIHPFTMQQVIGARIPIRIKNVMNPRGAGTVIFPDSDGEEVLSIGKHIPNSGLIRSRSTPYVSSQISQRPKRPTAVTVKKNVALLNIHSNKRTRAHGFMSKIFMILDKYNLSVDLISSSEVHVSMALQSDTAELLSGPSDGAPPTPMPTANHYDASQYDDTVLNIASEDLHHAVTELREFSTIDIVSHMAIISLVGKQLRNMVGISGRFLSTLGQNQINIEMISQGASEINISCVIDEREADRALSVVHTNLFTFLDD